MTNSGCFLEEAQRRGHPSGISAGLPRPPSRARNDKLYVFIRRSSPPRGDEAIQLDRHAARLAPREDDHFEPTPCHSARRASARCPASFMMLTSSCNVRSLAKTPKTTCHLLSDIPSELESAEFLSGRQG